MFVYSCILLKILFNSLRNLLFTLSILFVGTKPQFSSIIKSCALNCKSYYVTERWLGGMLTNWSTIKLCIKKLERLSIISTALCIFVELYSTLCMKTIILLTCQNCSNEKSNI